MQESEEFKLPPEWLGEVVVKQAYGHMRYSQDVEMPEVASSKAESSMQVEKAQSTIKKHPIADHVYFSGVSETMQLPHESPEAIEKYLEFQYRLKAELKKRFNPTPNMS